MPSPPTYTTSMHNITEKEFQREVEALKSHRRISVNRPILDPDLPDLAAVRGGGQEIMALSASPNTTRSTSSSSSSSGGGHFADRSTRPVIGVDLRDDGPAMPSPGQQVTRGAGRQAFTARRREQQQQDTRPSSPSSPSSSRATRPRSPISSNSDRPLAGPTDPSHLFWVPASVHPEISPSHFRQFLQDHASRAADATAGPLGDANASSLSPINTAQISPPSPTYGLGASPHADTPPTSPIGLITRSSIARRGSTLRRQYRPDRDTDDDDDDDEDDDAKTPRRRPPAPKARQGEPTLSISDLQKLEALAEEASHSRDETELRSVLRRTMSISATTTTMDAVDALGGTSNPLDAVDAVPSAASSSSSPSEVADAPIIVPPPGQILRRAARTKIRKTSLSGSPIDGPSAPGPGLERGSSIRPSSSRRRGFHGSTRGTSWESRDSRDDAEAAAAVADRQSKPDLANAALTLMQRRDSQTSDQSSSTSGGDDDLDPYRAYAASQRPRPISDEATESIVDSYNRDSMMSTGSERTSYTSYTDADTSAAGKTYSGGDWSQSPQTPQSGTPTPTLASAATTAAQQRPMGGYFDVTPTAGSSGQLRQPSADQQATPGANATILSASPMQSPEHELQPAMAMRGVSSTAAQHERDRSNSDPPPQSSWPVPVSHVPPVPSFEKTRPAPHPPSSASSTPSKSYTTGSSAALDANKSAVGSMAPAQISAPHLPTVATPTPTPTPPAKAKEKSKKAGGFASWFGIGKDDDEGGNTGGAAGTIAGSSAPTSGTSSVPTKPSREERKREKQRKERRDEDGGGGTPTGAHSPSGKETGEKEKEKDVGSFLGALFGKKKGHDGDASHSGSHSHAGPRMHEITAGSLLDQRQRGAAAEMNRLISNYYRYPIHVERAVYRLSHIKLANPRRPLYEQVLISNLMFWYLSVVNRTQQQQQQQQLQQQQRQEQAQSPGQQDTSSTPHSSNSSGKSSPSSEPQSGGTTAGVGSAALGGAIADVSLAAAKGSSAVPDFSDAASTAPVPAPSTAPAPVPPPQKTKKSGLVKPDRAPPGGSRSAEVAIPAAGYGAQHRQINTDLAYQQQREREREHQREQQQYNLPASISVGQVIDPRMLQYAAYGGDNGAMQGKEGSTGGGIPRSTSTPTSFDTAAGLSGQHGNGPQQQQQQYGNGYGQNQGQGHSHSHSHSYTSSHGSVGSASSGGSPKTSPSLNAHRITSTGRGVASGSAGTANGGEHAWLSKGGSGNASGPNGALHRSHSGGSNNLGTNTSGGLDYYDAAVAATYDGGSSIADRPRGLSGTTSARRPGMSEASGVNVNGVGRSPSQPAPSSSYDFPSRGGGYGDDSARQRVLSGGAPPSARSKSGYVGSTPVGASSFDSHSRSVSNPSRRPAHLVSSSSSSISSTSSKSTSPSSMNFDLPGGGGSAPSASASPSTTASAGSSAMLEAAARLSQSRRQ